MGLVVFVGAIAIVLGGGFGGGFFEIILLTEEALPLIRVLLLLLLDDEEELELVPERLLQLPDFLMAVADATEEACCDGCVHGNGPTTLY